jgi:glutaredoxin
MRSRRVLQRSGFDFEEIDIESVAGAEAAMRSLNGGSGKVPTILIESEQGRHTLVEPSDKDLTDVLSLHRAGAEGTVCAE